VRRALLALVFVAALVPRAALVLLPNPTPDAAEYLMLARSLARGEGFTLPVKVRHDVGGPAVHDASAERAPLLPLMLAPLVAAGVGRDGPIAPAIQIPNALAGALVAVVAASCAAALARRRGLAPPLAERAALLAGIAVGLHPPLARASCMLWAEPLGVLLVLGAARVELASLDRDDARLGALEGILAALAPLARPELGAALVVLLVARASSGRRSLAGFAAAAIVLTVIARALGFGAPQSFLLRVSDFDDVMWGWGSAPPPSPSVVDHLANHGGQVAGAIARDVADDLAHSLRYAAPVVLLAAVAIGRAARRDADAGARRFAALAVTAFLAPALVWSTHDHFRFPIAAFAVAAPLAIVEGAVILEALGSRRAIAIAFVVVALGVELGPHVRYARRNLERWGGDDAARAGSPLWGGPEHDAIARRLADRLAPGQAFATAKPWGLALSSGRPAVLLPNRLRGDALRAFLDGHPEVRAVVIRRGLDPSDDPPRSEEPVAALDDLPGAREDLAGATIAWIR
jgi:hypothetical protein